MKKQQRLIQCYSCKGDGKIAYLYDGKEYWANCDNCFGEGTIPDPDEFDEALNDLVTAKEISYE